MASPHNRPPTTLVAVLAVVILVLVLGLVAELRCPSQELPAVIQAFTSWVPRIGITL
jgi:hypothetical protein